MRRGGMRGIRLGQVAGIQVEVDWSLSIVFVLVAANLGMAVLPDWHPEWSKVLVWSISFAAAFLFFASVLAHELSHALVGRAFDIRVGRITLFFLGGVAQLEEPPADAKGELAMAIAGPIMSLAIGIVATFVGLTMTDGATPEQIIESAGPLASLLLWLGPVNLVLAAFNMLPGFPLDGGRVLRSLLWWGSGNRDWATKWAARAGKGLAGALLGVGLLSLMSGAAVQGIWLGILGFFLFNAARSEDVMTRSLSALQGVRVGDVMRRLETLPRGAANAAAEKLLEIPPGEPVLIIDEEGRPVGLADVSDVGRYLSELERRRSSGRDGARPVAPADRGADSAQS